jgi:Myosin-like coiled-coil protein
VHSKLAQLEKESAAMSGAGGGSTAKKEKGSSSSTKVAASKGATAQGNITQQPLSAAAEYVSQFEQEARKQFRESESSLLLTESSEVQGFKEALSKKDYGTVRTLFIDALVRSKDSKKALQVNLDRMKELVESRGKLQSELVEMESKFEKATAKCAQLEKIYKEIQEKTKTMRESAAAMIAKESEQAETLQQQCDASIREVNEKLDADEVEMAKMSAENDDLKRKLEQVKAHLALTTEHYNHQLKTQDLQLQLKQARKAQQESRLQQKKYVELTRAREIESIEAQNHELASMLASYQSKTGDFERAVSESNQAVTLFGEKRDALAKILEQATTENERLNKLSRDLDIAVLRDMGQTQKVEQEVAVLVKEVAKKEALCRSLQAKRKASNSSSNPSLVPTAATGSVTVLTEFESDERAFPPADVVIEDLSVDDSP